MFCDFPSDVSDKHNINKGSQHEKNTFFCQYCSASFSCKPYLTDHQRIKHGIGSYNCDICQKAFRRPSELKGHMKKHQDGKIKESKKEKTKATPKELIIDCKECSLSFTEQDTFARHCREFHDRQFFCDLCQFSSKKSISNLITHRGRVHGIGDDMKCDLCD